MSWAKSVVEERAGLRLPICCGSVQVHKIIAGLLDAYTFLGDELALDMVVKDAESYYRNMYFKGLAS